MLTNISEKWWDGKTEIQWSLVLSHHLSGDYVITPSESSVSGAVKGGNKLVEVMVIWLVVSNIFDVHPYLGKIPIWRIGREQGNPHKSGKSRWRWNIIPFGQIYIYIPPGKDRWLASPLPWTSWFTIALPYKSPPNLGVAWLAIDPFTHYLEDHPT